MTANPRNVVQLVGAGPGDPDLLTVRALRAIEGAEVVLHDRLVDPRVLALAPGELVEVGKTAGGPSWTQADINAEILRHARAGRRTVRLKSGDPLVFGRADEEMDALCAAGIPFEIIPGVTAAVAAAAGAKVSLTRRGRNASLRLITGQDAKGFAEQDWRALVRESFAVYMGVRAARFLSGRLMLHGMAAETPVTVVENAGRPAERRLATTLAALAPAMEAEGVTGPAVLLVNLPARDARAVVVPAAATA